MMQRVIEDEIRKEVTDLKDIIKNCLNLKMK